jgi:hypothetical protein
MTADLKWQKEARTIEHAPWAYSERELLFADRLRDGIYQLQHKPGSVLDRSTILIRALIRDGLNELVDKGSVCTCQPS